MCGITALFAYRGDAPNVRPDELATITESMRPRGPDAGGTFMTVDSRVGMGSRRLAIIDLSDNGVQPMHDVERELTIVFNGEIYNYRELRQGVERRGARFHSNSDTEVLLQLYRHHGARMTELLRGMFAFAIWDSRTRELFVARDPYGIKPLYFADDGRTFRLASTVKALMAGGALPRTLDPAAVAGFFLLGSVPEPFTIRSAIQAVPAGSSFTVTSSGRSETHSFYSIPAIFRAAHDLRSVADLTTPPIQLRETMLESVGYHLVSDVPIGVFLSAGIDSTTVASVAAEQTDHLLQAVTIVFEGLEGTEFDEAAEAERFAYARGMEHVTRKVTWDEFLADMPRFFDAMDQPTIDGINTWFVSKATAERKVKVAISGIGGDELLGSYPAFSFVPRVTKATRLARRVPMGRSAMRAAVGLASKFGGANPKAREIPQLGATTAGAYLLKRGLYLPSELPSVLGAAAAEEGLAALRVLDHVHQAMLPEPREPFGQIASLEATLYMRNQLLRDTDWASMAHSVEVRTPLVDAFLLRQLAPLLVQQGSKSKEYFTLVPDPPLPDSIARRPKTGFVAPVSEWLDLPDDGTTTRSRSWAREVLERYQ